MDDDKTTEHDDGPRKLKVTDRRKFTASGDLRDDEPAEPAAADESADAAAADPGPSEQPPPASPRTADAAGEAAAAGEPAAPDAAPQGPVTDIADLPRDFTAFIEGMYIETMLYLGAIPDPRTGEVAEDPDMAKYKIDLLGMLQEKTRGNLTDAEAQQLEEVLYQLRMFFVQKGQQPDG